MLSMIDMMMSMKETWHDAFCSDEGLLSDGFLLNCLLFAKWHSFYSLDAQAVLSAFIEGSHSEVDITNFNKVGGLVRLLLC